HSYNFTYVHRGISFESALIDAITRIRTGESSHVLAGGTDELTANYFTITDRMGFWKRKPVDSLHLFADTTRGTVAGEGAAFFLLQNNPGGKTYARLDGITTFLDPGSFDGVTQKMDAFLQSQQTAIGDIDLVLLGMNGDPGSDGIYHFLASNRLKNTPLAYFKHLSGEYHTASSFALWLAAMILKDGRVPEIVRPESLPGTPQKQVQVPGSIRKLLIYNHFRKNNHSLILLSRP
ncbi:MAG TPA: beta-ketoacyl synthase N-terminal-like domain-containing protein, partial [Bacteroidales bacterium]|nr:beta-ketoacyl synthase N-terminal-like domain-containing protein [Bacteroidales bacterium]